MTDLMPRDRRIPKSLAVVFQQGSSWVKAYAKDISRGGLFVLTESPLNRGERFDLKLQLPGWEERLDLSCEVAWTSTEKDRPGGGMGVRFVHIPSEHAALLKPFVAVLERLEVKPFVMTDKDSRVLKDQLNDIKGRPTSRSGH